MPVCKECRERPVVLRGMCRRCYDKQKIRADVICVECGKKKPHAAFGLCRTCNGRRVEVQEAYLKRTYGITFKEYDEMFEAQGGVCAICGRESTQRFCVDHDHETGKIRGLLCCQCNLVLGNSGDDIDVLASAIKYLRSR